MRIIELKQLDENINEIVIGMDEAGRGPAIGPMIIGLCVIEPDWESKLRELGVMDSKILRRPLREELSQDLHAILPAYGTLEVTAQDIDTFSFRGINLNQLNVKAYRKLLTAINFKSDTCTLQLDAADVIEERFGSNFVDIVKGPIYSKHKGDSLFPTVSAASILAKVERDKQMDIINVKMKEFDPDLPEVGSGYVNPKTKLFMKSYYAKYSSYPNFVRESWKTSSEIESELNQRESTIDEFF